MGKGKLESQPKSQTQSKKEKKETKKEKEQIEIYEADPSKSYLVMKKFGSNFQKWAPVLKVSILGLISVLAFLVRIFSVIRYESIIHEFDPWFNFRSTKYLAKEGFYNFWNWFDSESWYPIGRAVGPTIFPGIMGTAASVYWALEAISLPVDIRNICVFTGPVMSAATAIATYLLAKQINKRSETGLLAALFVSICPSYISRSVAGSYDNEAVAIFALIFTFYLWVKSVDTGSVLWGMSCSLSFGYMVAAWGGYSFIINIIPLFTLAMLILDRWSLNLYVAYSVFYIFGNLFAIQIPFVGRNAIKSSEHLASHGVFIVSQAYMALQYLKEHLSQVQIKMLTKTMLTIVFGGALFAYVGLMIFGLTKWGGRSMTLLDPTYAKKYIPIIASVSEHQATLWTNYFFDLQVLMFLVPVGFYYCTRKPNYGKLFLGMYGVLSIYFSCVMIRLMLVMAPAACLLAALGASAIIRKFSRYIRVSFRPQVVKMLRGQKMKEKKRVPSEISVGVLLGMGVLLSLFILHSTWSGAEAYSSPTVILSSRGPPKHIIDDYREAYHWLRMNSKQDAKVMSWWDYGYQLTGLANRTVLVDNNTWNYTHIATVGKAFASREEEAFEIVKSLDVDYVLVIFGGASYYSSDDISKFLWMVRIGGGVYPKIKEPDYYGGGQYRVDAQATESMKNCLMYKMCYYRFGELRTRNQEPSMGYDTVRNVVIGKKDISFKHFEEAYTSERWIVRIYKVLKTPNRAPGVNQGKQQIKTPGLVSSYTKILSV